MKPLSEDQIACAYALNGDITEKRQSIKYIIEQARIGMAPAVEAVGFEECQKIMPSNIGGSAVQKWYFEQGQRSLLATEGIVDLREAMKEWPASSVGIRIQYQWSKMDHFQVIKDIPRPAPKWRPMKSDYGKAFVFWDNDSTDEDTPTLGTYWRSEDEGYCDGHGWKWQHCALVKDLSDIGQTVGWFKANREWV